MAVQDKEPENNDRGGFNYYPTSASKSLSLEQQFQLRAHAETLKHASREQLYEYILDSFCLLYNTQTICKQMLKEGNLHPFPTKV